ncbi:metalloprotease [Atractiella rhizophila]|nr:metalloprotease [Atractiella rhizophila]
MLSKIATVLAFSATAFAAPTLNQSARVRYAILPLSLPSGLTRQCRTCGTTVTPEQVATHNKEFETLLAAKGKSLADYSRTSRTAAGARISQTVSVYFHVIYASESIDDGYIPDSQISDQIDVMNAAYADSGISFKLAGTDRTKQATWFNTATDGTSAQTQMKTQLRKGGAADLNVYTVGFKDGSGLLGYSTFPSDYSSDPDNDGCVILYSSLPGGSATPFDEGQTLTHEAGHWFGLYHVFDDYGSSCDDYDQVSDTPPQKTATSGCPTGKDSCSGGGVDSIHNYMDYSDDSCMTEFTEGQATRMAAQVGMYRGLE